MSPYEHACALTVAVHDQDAETARALLSTVSRSGLEALALTLAAMGAPDVGTPAGVVAASTRFAAIAEEFERLGPARFDMVAHHVVQIFDVTIGELFSPSQKKRPTEARQVLCWIARRDGMSFSEIGRRISRDHTTVMSAVAAVDNRVDLRTKANVVLNLVADVGGAA